jgi:hypothetical protein
MRFELLVLEGAYARRWFEVTEPLLRRVEKSPTFIAHDCAFAGELEKKLSG